MEKMNWVKVEDGNLVLSKQYLVFDPSAVVKCYTAFYLPYKEGDKEGYFTNGMTIAFNVTHYCEIPKHPTTPSQEAKD